MDFGLLLLSESDTVTAAELPARIGQTANLDIDLYGEFKSLAQGVAAFEQHLVNRTLLEESGNRDVAATRLGIDRAELDGRLEKG